MNDASRNTVSFIVLVLACNLRLWEINELWCRRLMPDFLTNLEGSPAISPSPIIPRSMMFFLSQPYNRRHMTNDCLSKTSLKHT